AGTHYLIVDGQSGSEGPFTLAAGLSNPMPPAASTCAAAPAITPGTTWLATTGPNTNSATFACYSGSTSAEPDGVFKFTTPVTGSTLGASDDLGAAFYTGGRCGQDAFPGADVVYKYTSTAATPVTVTVTPERGFDVGLAVLSACSEDSCLRTEDIGFQGELE